MKKPTMIITKKQIILACLTLILGVAVYVNYILSQGAGLELDDAKNANSDAVENYGEAEFVSGNAADEASNNETDSDYFAQARLEKLTSRDTAVETLQSIIGGGDITGDEMVTRAIEAVNISQYIETESNIEMLIKAQGFEDCLAYLDDETAKIVIKSDGLTSAEAAAIKDIILTETVVIPENIRIFEVK